MPEIEDGVQRYQHEGGGKRRQPELGVPDGADGDAVGVERVGTVRPDTVNILERDAFAEYLVAVLYQCKVLPQVCVDFHASRRGQQEAEYEDEQGVLHHSWS